MKRSHVANENTIDADTNMHDEEDYEVFVVVEAHTVVNPDTMMVEPFTAHIAKGAVLAASGFRSLARVAPALRSKHDFIVVVPFYGAFKNRFVNALLEVAWIGRTGQVVGIVACQHPGTRNVLVVAIELGVWEVHEAVHDIHVVGAYSKYQVHHLNRGICLIAYVSLGALHEPYYTLTSRQLSQTSLYCNRDRLVEQTLGLRLYALAFDVDKDETVEEGCEEERAHHNFK